jgi:hypothetical protein
VAAAARVGRHDPVRILSVAIVVSVATVLTEALAHHLADPHSAWQSGVAAVLSEAVGLLGTVFLAGFLCRLTGEAGGAGEAGEAGEAGGPAAARGGTRVTIGHVLRTLPWGRLIAADLTVAVLIIIGLFLLVLPGLILLNLLAVVGPLIEIEDQTVRAALRRSRRLVRPYFWPVALLATLPFLVLVQIESFAPDTSGGPRQVAAALAIRGVAGGALEAAVSLVLVQLCYRLIRLEAAAATPAPPPPAGAA